MRRHSPCGYMRSYSTGLLRIFVMRLDVKQVVLDYFADLLKHRAEAWCVAEFQRPRLLQVQLCCQQLVQVPAPVQVGQLVQAAKQVAGSGNTAAQLFRQGLPLPHHDYMLEGEPGYELRALPKKQAKSTSPPSLGRALSDVEVFRCLRLLVADLDPQQCQVIMPGAASALLQQQEAGGISAQVSVHISVSSPVLVCVFASQGHWGTLVVQQDGSGFADAFYLDGVPGRLSQPATRLFQAIARSLGVQPRSMQEVCHFTQVLPHECGQIALCHACTALGYTPAAAKQQVDTALGQVCPSPGAFVASGGLSDAQHKALATLLVDKGVPAEHVDTRIQAATKAIGAGPVAEALQGKNPWQLLKGAGSRLGHQLRWVLADELATQVERKAQAQFGTAVNGTRSKKRKPSQLSWQLLCFLLIRLSSRLHLQALSTRMALPLDNSTFVRSVSRHMASRSVLDSNWPLFCRRISR